jgi:CRP/FNR family transcriptional regulator, anaerobic regulatory protein
MAELEVIHSSNNKQRLVQFILGHASATGVLAMTQQHIAQHLGTTREVIARLLTELVSRKLVRSQRGSISILDLCGLRRIVVPGRVSTTSKHGTPAKQTGRDTRRPSNT